MWFSKTVGISLTLAFLAAAFLSMVYVDKYNTHKAHTNAVIEFALKSGCKDVGLLDPKHNMTQHIQNILTCPDQSVVVVPK